MPNSSTLVILPTYNEIENVGPLAEQILSIAPDADLLLVDNNSPDGTADHAEKLFAKEPRFSVLRREGPRGLGRSYVDGYKTAVARGYARLIQMDADFSHDPARLPDILKAARAADVVIGSRYCPGGGIGNWPLRRRALSRFANFYVSKITGMKVGDATSGYRCYSRRALEYVLQNQIAAEGYAFLVESIYRLSEAGFQIAEVPIIFVDRREGQSKISRKVIFESVLIPWRLRLLPRIPAEHKFQTQDN
jgi:dolichol-phosphate mannosyltransferase